MTRRFFPLLLLGLLALPVIQAQESRLEIPRRHDRPPGPPLSPEQARAKMTVPDGFSVELVAAEPDVINPVSMCIDERGRFWITESFEYPRREPGPGRDRIKVLEDTDGDGKVDKTTVFADGLNIPSGIAVGHGGVWVANAPDLLFLKDTDGDLKADTSEVVVTGFGRTDTHELPNSLTWGPDGWLYGLNGVFNYSHVRYSPENPNFREGHEGWPFTCALFRIHPRTREFQVFAEGTSNPWGIAINGDGEFFLSACVIDHLWHIVETGYYIRQGGPYPPHTWPIGSIVEHRHQKAAYCGITWFDSDAYPERYRNVLYMGNIHGGCINADIVERDGATYKGRPHPGFPARPDAWDDDEYDLIRKRGSEEEPLLADFLSANDAWFMPVVQKTGPDGCLYILDWYDRYHCYQDANADSEGIDRGRGRLYRVVYDKTGRQPVLDLSDASDDELFDLLGHANVFYRETAQRLLSERSTAEIIERLQTLVHNADTPRTLRQHAIYALLGCDLTTDDQWLSTAQEMYHSGEPGLQVWALRLLSSTGLSVMQQQSGEAYELAAAELVKDALTSPDVPPQVRLQAIIFVGRLSELRPSYVVYTEDLATALKHSHDDPLMPQILWPALRHYLDHDASILAQAADFCAAESVTASPAGRELVRRLLDWIVDQPALRPADYRQLLTTVVQTQADNAQIATDVLHLVSRQLRGRRLNDQLAAAATTALQPIAEKLIGESKNPESRFAAAVLLSRSGHDGAMDILRQTARQGERLDQRIEALSNLISRADDSAISIAADLLSGDQTRNELHSAVIATIAESREAKVADVLLDRYGKLAPEVQPRVIEVLTQRPDWARRLLEQIAAEKIDRDALNVNQLLRLASIRNEPLQQQLQKIYGQIRTGRSDRQDVINRTRDFLNGTPGDPFAGEKVFNKVCAQCHKMYGEGVEVGPDITRNGRNDWDQLLRNVLDPSQVIGPGYQARQVLLSDGRVLTGLAVEENDQRVVLKLQGGKLETIPREEIDDYKVSELSMMPEGLEKQISPQELADLFAYLALDRPPSDPQARRLSGAPAPKTRSSE